MKVIQHTPTQLTLKEINWLTWFFGIVLAGNGAFFTVQALQRRDFPDSLAIIFFVVGLLLLLISEINICDFNADTGKFTLKRQKLLGTKYIPHPLSDLVKAEVESNSGPEATHKVVIVLLCDKRVPLSNWASSDYESKQRTVTLINNFLHQVSI